MLKKSQIGQSAAKPLSLIKYEEGSETILKGSRKEISEMRRLYEFNKNIKYPKIKCIYRILCLKNNKNYIGSTFNFNNRIKRHLYDLENKTHHSQKLQRAFNKYTKKEFNIFILKVNPVNVIEEENNWIKYYNSIEKGFNMIIATNDFKSFKMSEESINKAIKNSKKEIISFTLDGKIYKKYLSVSDCARDIKTSTSNITKCCRDNTLKLKNLTFIYAKDYDKNKSYSYNKKVIKRSEEYKNHIKIIMKNRKVSKETIEKAILTKYKRVYKYDLNMNFLKIYTTKAEAARLNNCNQSSIARSILHNKPCKGFIYSYDKI